MEKWEIIRNLNRVNKGLDYELSPAYLNFGLWDVQIQALYNVRDTLLRQLKEHRVEPKITTDWRSFGMP